MKNDELNYKMGTAVHSPLITFAIVGSTICFIGLILMSIYIYNNKKDFEKNIEKQVSDLEKYSYVQSPAKDSQFLFNQTRGQSYLTINSTPVNSMLSLSSRSTYSSNSSQRTMSNKPRSPTKKKKKNSPLGPNTLQHK